MALGLSERSRPELVAERLLGELATSERRSAHTRTLGTLARPARNQSSSQAHRQRLERAIAGPFEGAATEATLGAFLHVYFLELLPAGERHGGVRFLLVEAAQGQDTRLIAMR